MTQKNKGAPTKETDIINGYIGEDGEVLMTEAEAREKLEAEIRKELEAKLKKENVKESTKKPEEGNDDFLEFVVSGCYYDSRKETIDFDGLVVKVPANTEDIAEMHVRSRYVIKAIKEAKHANGEPRYPNRVEKVRQVHVDDVRPCKGRYTFVGKNIKELDMVELQDLATRKDLRFIPLPNSGMSRRDMLIRAYVAFSAKVFKKDIKWQDEKFNFAKLPEIIVDGRVRSEGEGKITNEEMIEQEQNAPATSYGEKDDPRKRFTLDELKTIANNKHIDYADNIDFTSLYNRLFSA